MLGAGTGEGGGGGLLCLVMSPRLLGRFVGVEVARGRGCLEGFWQERGWERSVFCRTGAWRGFRCRSGWRSARWWALWDSASLSGRSILRFVFPCDGFAWVAGRWVVCFDWISLDGLELWARGSQGLNGCLWVLLAAAEAVEGVSWTRLGWLYAALGHFDKVEDHLTILNRLLVSFLVQHFARSRVVATASFNNPGRAATGAGVVFDNEQQGIVGVLGTLDHDDLLDDFPAELLSMLRKEPHDTLCVRRC